MSRDISSLPGAAPARYNDANPTIKTQDSMPTENNARDKGYLLKLKSHSSLPGGDHSSPSLGTHGHAIIRLTTIQVCSSPAGRVRSGKSRAFET